jgi:predicted polyphosphate/ATP-dependent NAD kinase
MASIGIIANPASGKDIRRLVSYATVIDNNEKVNIVKRIILAAQNTGVSEILFMPDTFNIGYAALDELEHQGVLTLRGEVLEMPLRASASDTTEAAREMQRRGAGCIVVLGGDGTSRAVAKAETTVPLLPISTGTNNVYPRLVEGTVAGMAASAVAQFDNPRQCCIHDKRIEVYLNGRLADIALIDAVLSNDLYAGAKAIWHVDNLRRMVVSRCHPATIGFSAVAGSMRILRDTDEGGFALSFGTPGKRIRAAIAAGVVAELSVREERLLADGQSLRVPLEKSGMVALDGERELKVKEGEELSFRVCRNGPWRVDMNAAIETAMRLGMYNL